MTPNLSPQKKKDNYAVRYLIRKILMKNLLTMKNQISLNLHEKTLIFKNRKK